VLLVAAQVRQLLNLESLTGALVGSVFPLGLALVLVGVGVAVARGQVVETADARRFAGWVAAGAAIFLFTGAWILALDVFLGYSTPGRVVITTNAVTLGAIVGVVVGLYDARTREQTRQLRRRERRLARRNRHLDDFVSVVPHDLRNPLNVAMARTELASEECDSEHLADVVRAHDRMEALIEDLLTLARQEEETIEMETIDLATMVRRCWRNVDTGDGSPEIDGDRSIRGDESRLTRLFENLLRNAVEHGSTGSAEEPHDSVADGSTGGGPAAGDGERVAFDGNGVTVGAREGGFYVADDGPGIPPDEREQVFESGYSTSSEGTGFGLSIVREIVDAHGWEISVEESEDGGARFVVTGVEAAE
jgi:signal transduction histidine kinase